MKLVKDTSTNVRPGLSLALGAGGARGVCYLGVMKALEAAGLPISSLTGISAGAVAAAIYAFEPDMGRVTERVTRSLLSESFTGSKFEHYLSLTRKGDGPFASIWDAMRSVFALGSLIRSPALLTAEDQMKYVAELIPEGRIEDAQIPLAVVALDLTSGKKVCLRQGDVRRAIAASTAIPGIFPPVEWKSGNKNKNENDNTNGNENAAPADSYRLVDAGMVAPVPIETARSWTRGPLVAVDVMSDYEPSRDGDNGLALLMRMQHSQMQVNRDSLLRHADLVLRPAIDVLKLPLSAEIMADCIHAGEQAVENALPAIRRLLLSHEDGVLLDVVIRHRLLRTDEISTAVARTIQTHGGFADVLRSHLDADAIALARELADHLLLEDAQDQAACALGEAVSAGENGGAS